MEKIKTILKKLKIDKIYKVIRVFCEEGYYVLIYKIKYGKSVQVDSPSEYQKWIKYNEEDILETKPLEYNPLISIVIPVYNVPDQMLIDCIESVLNQTYTNWQLCLADDHSSQESMREILKSYEDHTRIRVVYREENGHISKATNSAIELAEGEFIAFMDCDDLLAPNALYDVAVKLNENPEYDFIYSDEDKVDSEGIIRWDPHFKPDWSPDTLMAMMYTSHLGVYRATIVRELGGLREGFEGSQDYDFTLRFTEKTNKIGHIPKVLYHWRQVEGSTAAAPEAKPYVFEAAKKAKQEALNRRGLNGKITFMPNAYQMRVIYENPEHPLVSIIIPSKDNYEIYERCIETLKQITSYPNYEIINVDNGSNKDNKKKYEQLNQKYGCQYCYKKMEFNFSQMCNIGASKATGEFLLFLNDDIEIINEDWLNKMVGQASQNHIGAVGAKLYYPNSTLIQHCGVVNLSLGPSHFFSGYDDSQIYYFGRNIFDYNVSAVTGACLLVSREKFEEIGGYDEKLPVAYNDVDLCFRLIEAGYYNVVRNDAILYHHESISRGYDNKSKEKMERLIRERTKLYEKHPLFVMNDPFYSRNLTQYNINCDINTQKMVAYNNLKKVDAKEPFTEDENLIGKIDCVMKMDHIFIQGYAYFANKMLNNQRITKILLEGETESFLVETNKIYRPDLQQLLNTRKHINLSGFNCFINMDDLHDSEYTMKIILDDKIANEDEVLLL